MITVELEHAADFDGWRSNARRLVREGQAPEQVVWQFPGGNSDLFGDTGGSENRSGESGSGTNVGGNSLKVSRHFIDLARRVVCHQDPARFALLYRLLWRQGHGEAHLLHDVCDDDVHRAVTLGKSIGRDMHKMRAFLRFRRSNLPEVEHYHAWFEPDHHILRYNCDFFRRRFAAMNWSIATPEGSAHWDGEALRFGPAVDRDTLPDSEPMEDLWRTYFANIFNPARLRLDAMRSEMPMKYWKNLPEASLIAPLTRQASVRTAGMVAAAPTRAPRFAARALHVGKPSDEHSGKPGGVAAGTLASLAQELSSCERCAHACHATRAVPGAGASNSSLMLLGEQPGDQEDLRGQPFVGPAGQLLRELLLECGPQADNVYMTNAVKHFKFSVRGKLRLHQRPSEEDIAACQPWLQREIELVAPRVIVALGATAARALLGRPVKVQAERGHWLRFSDQCRLLITTHPSFVLRQHSAVARAAARESLQSDLRLASSFAAPSGRSL